MNFQNMDDLSEITVEEEQIEINFAGYIYIIHNEMYKFYGDDVYKIGKAHCIENRLKSYITGYVDPTSLLYSSIQCKNYSVCEREVHKRLQKYRMRPNREFFQVNSNIAIEVIESVVLELNELDDEALNKYHNDIKDIRQKRILKPEIVKMNENAFEELIQFGKTEDTVLLSNLNILNLNPFKTDVVIKYHSILTDKLKLHEHFNIIQSLMNESVLNPQSNICQKLEHIKSLEQRMKIQKYQINAKIDDIIYFDISDDEYQLICKLFRIVRKKPSTNYELFKLYISMLRNVMTSEIVISTKGTTRANQKISYKLNKDFVKFHIDLNMFSNPYLRNFDAETIHDLYEND